MENRGDWEGGGKVPLGWMNPWEGHGPVGYGPLRVTCGASVWGRVALGHAGL